MGTRFSQGFTIIETTLFLAISGALIVALIFGAGASLNVQRYRDATESLKALVQRQYSELNNVQNGREDTFSCDATATISAGGDERRGQSECVLVGKYMRIDQQEISIYTVLAYRIADTNQTSDIETLKNDFALNASTTQVEERRMDWGTEVAWATSGLDYDASGQTPRTIGILIIRSPDTGLVYTFTQDSIPPKDGINQATFTDLLVAGDGVPRQGQSPRNLCVLSNGLTVAGDRSVYIGAFAASASAIETHTNDSQGDISEC